VPIRFAMPVCPFLIPQKPVNKLSSNLIPRDFH